MEAAKTNGFKYKINLSDHLRVGQHVDVEIKEVKKRFTSKVVGFSLHEYLIVQMPDVAKFGFIKDELKDDRNLIMRSVFECTTGEAAAFNCSVLTRINSPCKLLITSFPKKIITHELRREDRERTQIPAKIFQSIGDDEDRKYEGTIVNLSAGGCAFELNRETHVRKIKKEEIYIEFIPEGSGIPVTLHADVRSQKVNSAAILVGLAFKEEFIQSTH